MGHIPKTVYTKGFREEAIKLVKESGLSIREIAKRLSIPTGTLAYWVKKDKAANRSGKGEVITKEEMEYARLKRENAQLKLENEILKKAAAYFAKESL